MLRPAEMKWRIRADDPDCGLQERSRIRVPRKSAVRSSLYVGPVLNSRRSISLTHDSRMVRNIELGFSLLPMTALVFGAIGFVVVMFSVPLIISRIAPFIAQRRELHQTHKVSV